MCISSVTAAHHSRASAAPVGACQLWPLSDGTGMKMVPSGRYTCSHDLVATSSPRQHTNAHWMCLYPLHVRHSLVTRKRVAAAGTTGCSRQRLEPLRAHLQPGSLP